MNLRRRVIDLGFRAFAGTGLHRLAAPFTQGIGAILMFHRVGHPPLSDFDPLAGLQVTPDFLDTVLDVLDREGLEVVSMDEAVARLRRAGRGESVQRFASLTFDDGTRCTLQEALPRLRRRNAPFTVYVTTGYADHAAAFWWVELERAIGRLSHVPWRANRESLSLPARSAEEKNRAFDLIYRDLRQLPEAELRARVAELGRLAGVESVALTAELCMDWDEVRQLASEPLCAIGAHTLTHPQLSLLDEDAARAEIAGSGAILSAKLGRPIDHFCYPFGDASAAGARCFRMAREAGYVSAVTTRPGALFPEHAEHLHALPRIYVSGLMQRRAVVETMVSGAPFAIRNRFRRLDVA